MSDFDDMTGPAEVSDTDIEELAVVEDDTDGIPVVIDDDILVADDDIGALSEKKDEEEESENEDSDFMEYMYGDQLTEL
jgi:hypothetical protein